MTVDLAGVAAETVERATALGGTGVGIARRPKAGAPGSTAWPKGTETLVVLTLAHPEAEPDLDYWGVPGGTVGNRRQKQLLAELAGWFRDGHAIDARPLSYQVEQGGTLLKDAAVLAGLGVIGDNNLLITPDLGPRVRLRALAVAAPLTETERSELAPCESCPRPCFAACPQNAFESGSYDRARCQRQMALDEQGRATRLCAGQPQSVIAYCRACELACMVPG